MSIDQQIRFRDPQPGDPTNEEGLYSFVSPSRILVLPRDPIDATDGQNFYYCINSTDGTFWFKSALGIWSALPFTFNVGSGGIVNLANDGIGAPIFKSVVTNVAHLRSLSSTSGKIVFTTLANEINLGVNITSADVGLNNVLNIKSVFNQSSRPTVTQDSTQGFVIGSLWQYTGNPSQSELYINQSNVINNAIWTLIGPGSAVPPLANVGTGQHVYVDATSAPSQIRTLESTLGRITIATTPTTLNFGVNLTKNDVGLNNVVNIRNTYAAARSPGPTDDITQGYLVGSTWNDIVTDAPSILYWVCSNAATGAAQWVFLGPSNSVNSDLCFAQMQSPPPHGTTFTSYNTPVLLNIGFLTYNLSQVRGNWVAANSGSGPVNILYTPTNGLANNKYEITYNWNGNVTGSTSGELLYTLTMNTGTGASPSTGVIPGSATRIVIAASGRFASATKTFVYNAPTNGQNNFFISVFASSGITIPPTQLNSEDFTITFRQI